VCISTAERNDLCQIPAPGSPMQILCHRFVPNSGMPTEGNSGDLQNTLRTNPSEKSLIWSLRKHSKILMRVFSPLWSRLEVSEYSSRNQLQTSCKLTISSSLPRQQSVSIRFRYQSAASGNGCTIAYATAMLSHWRVASLQHQNHTIQSIYEHLMCY